MEGKGKKKKCGRPSLNLSASAEKERKREQDKARQSKKKAVFLDQSTHERWIALADRKGVTARKLAVMLVDAAENKLRRRHQSQGQGEYN